jgi:hypothetical protein
MGGIRSIFWISLFPHSNRGRESFDEADGWIILEKPVLPKARPSCIGILAVW